VRPFREIRPLEGPVDAVVTVPGSKSVTNRALICAALAQGRSRLTGAGFSDDARHMAASLRALGARIEEDAEGRTFVVDGMGRPPRIAPGAEIPKAFVGNAGTAARFLPCLVAAGAGRSLFDSEARMRERPMGPLVKVLRAQGARFSDPESGLETDRYPFLLDAFGLKGGEVELDLTDSSQFASGLMMAAPYAAAGLVLKAHGDRLQFPYVDMTAAVMGQFGASVEGGQGLWKVAAGAPYSARESYAVEPDVSGAAYFYAAVALVPGRITVRGVSNASIQGDVRFLKVLHHLGLRYYRTAEGLQAERFPEEHLRGGVTVDMNAFSDQALTLAVLAPFASAPVKIVNVAHIRRQECDRIRAIAENLGALGVDVSELPDGVEIRPWPKERRRGGLIKTYGDHRVAMAFSLIGLAVPGIVIDEPACVSKTFGDYWEVLESLRGGAHGA